MQGGKMATLVGSKRKYKRAPIPPIATMMANTRIGMRRRRRSPRGSLITGGEISEAVAMLSHLIPVLRESKDYQPEHREKKTNDAEHDASNGHSPSGIALRVGVNLDQADDRKDQAKNVERHAIATTTGNHREHRKNS